MEAKGQKFDPGFHQAIYEADVPDAQPGTVAEEIQAGYAIGERVLRPALVSVVKRPAKTAAPAETPAEEAEPEPSAGRIQRQRGLRPADRLTPRRGW